MSNQRSSFHRSRVLLLALLFSVLAGAIETFPAQAQTNSQGCVVWNNPTAWPFTLNPNVGVGFAADLSFYAGDTLRFTFTLAAGTTSANVSIREPINTIIVGPETLDASTEPVMLTWIVPADGDYRAWAVNAHTSDGPVNVVVECLNYIEPPEPEPELTLCEFTDGRINRYDCDASAVIYHEGDSVAVYAVHPDTSRGERVLRIPLETILEQGVPENEHLLLAEMIHPQTGFLLTLWRLTTGELQLNTYLRDGKPYVIVWQIGGNPMYTRLE
jgi:hypothetical protein